MKSLYKTMKKLDKLKHIAEKPTNKLTIGDDEAIIQEKMDSWYSEDFPGGTKDKLNEEDIGYILGLENEDLTPFTEDLENEEKNHDILSNVDSNENTFQQKTLEDFIKQLEDEYKNRS